MDKPTDSGDVLHGWVAQLFPICRSLTGDGVRRTLGYLKNLLGDLQIKEVPTGSIVGDWVVPDEWNIRSALVSSLDGTPVIDFANSNLHVVSYSEPINEVVTRDELLKHIHSLPNQPDAIPYVTSYYSRTWGFCLAHRDMGRLVEDEYRVTIDSDLSPGSLTYAEMLIPGASAEEVLLTTYVCHPSMANNELSGPVVMTALGRWLASQENLRYSYRLLFLPETIGAITYLSEHLDELKQNVVAGWVLTCIGDDRTYSFVPSRLGNTLADRISKAVLTELNADFTEYSYLDRGSDERQWCAPGVDLPVASLMRSKYGTFDEYHTSLDDLEFVTPSGLQGGLDMMSSAIQLLEGNFRYKLETIGEPQLGKRGLRPNLGTKETASLVRNMMNVLIYSDGNHDVLEVSSVVGVPTAEVISISENLAKHGLLSRRG